LTSVVRHSELGSNKGNRSAVDPSVVPRKTPHSRRFAEAQGGEGFPKKARLTRRSEFLRLSRAGRKSHTSHFVIIGKPNDKGESRLGITVSSRVGKAVVRNRIKRRLREFFRRHLREIAPAQDIVIIARKGAENLSLREVTGELKGVLALREKRPR